MSDTPSGTDQPPVLPPENPPTAPVLAAELGFGQRLVSAFTAPSRLFADLGRKAGWNWLVIPFLGAILLSTSTAVFLWRADPADIAYAMQEMQPAWATNLMSSTMSQEQIQQQFENQARMQRYMGPALAPIQVVFMMAIAGLILWLVWKVMGSKAGFLTALACAATAFGVPWIVKEGIAAVIFAVRDPADILMSGFFHNVVPSNAAAIIGWDNLSARLYMLLMLPDLFIAWTLILVAKAGRHGAGLKGAKPAGAAAIYFMFQLMCMAPAAFMMGK